LLDLLRGGARHDVVEGVQQDFHRFQFNTVHGSIVVVRRDLAHPE